MINFLRKSEALRDWYVVDGSWAQPEGSKEEWLEVIDGIEASMATGKMDAHYTGGRRLAVNLYNNQAEFYSPRNQSSDDDVSIITREDLPAWLEQAKRTLNEQP